MKNIGLVCWLLVSICCGLQAKKIVKTPYFMACNTRSIEVERVILGEDTTWLDVKIYGMQGDKVRIDSAPYCRHPESIMNIGGIPVFPEGNGQVFLLPVK